MTDRRPEDEAPPGGHWTEEDAPPQGEPPAWEQGQAGDPHPGEAYPGEEAVAAEPQPVATETSAARRGSRLPVIALAVLIAFLAGAAAWPLLGPLALAQLPASWSLGGAEQAAAVEALEARVAALESRAAAADPVPQRLAELQDRLNEIETRAQAPAPAVQELAGRVDAMQRDLEALREQMAGLSERAAAAPSGENAPAGETADRIAALEGRLSDMQARLEAGSGDAVADQAVAQLTERLAALERGLQQADQAEQQVQSLQAQNAQLQQRLQQLESTVATVAEQSEAARAGSRREALVLAIGQLDEAVESGSGYQAELDAVRALAPEDQALSSALAQLAPFAERGVEERAELRARFDEMAGAVVRAAAAGPDADWLDQARQRLSSLVTIRRTGDVAGETADAIVARAEVQLERGDLAGAAAALGQLQGPAAEAAAAWLEDAKARLAAEEALQALGARAIALVAG